MNAITICYCREAEKRNQGKNPPHYQTMKMPGNKENICNVSGPWSGGGGGGCEGRRGWGEGRSIVKV